MFSTFELDMTSLIANLKLEGLQPRELPSGSRVFAWFVEKLRRAVPTQSPRPGILVFSQARAAPHLSLY